ncbi:TIGR04197 family type VII secretion effector [Bacillus sp. LK2]|uniref:TIGR04197 family type VII secretion effector n=1 Tax=Bacillus sp. LK2 TaxID=1628206 RepID=UPI000652E569|nr:TIGR04197 family type VII secretion effector [Bacillus sp. LK2]KMN42444.1 type VII secretion effector [Bacillus sp. LK2]
MSGIKSDLGRAQQKATALKSATDILIQSSSISNETDTQTTVAGNTNAQEAIQIAQETAKQVALAIATAANNIHSVAGNFEALDQLASQTGFNRMGRLNS